MADPEPTHAAHPGAPRWVKIAAVVVALVVVVLVISKLAGVEHGPGRHGGDTTAPAGAERHERPPGAEGHRPPAGVPQHDAP